MDRSGRVYRLKAFFTLSLICQVFRATFWWLCHCIIMVIFRHHVGPASHHRLIKYFTSTHPALTGTFLGPKQIDDKQQCIWMCPNQQCRSPLLIPSRLSRHKSAVGPPSTRATSPPCSNAETPLMRLFNRRSGTAAHMSLYLSCCVMPQMSVLEGG